MKQAIALLGFVLFLSAPTLAQVTGPIPNSRIEIWGGWALAFPTSDGLLQSDYEPVMRLGGIPLSSQTVQALTVRTESGGGFHAGVHVFFSRQLGMQVAFMRSAADVVGTPGEYRDSLTYVSLPPPSYEPVENFYERDSPAPAAAGRLTSHSLALGGVVRWRAAGGRIGGTVAGGISFDRHSGEVENVIYTQFILGGHSTLFPVHHRVVMELTGDRHDVAPYVAADFHVTIMPRVAILVGMRGTLGPRVTLATRPVRLVDPNEDTWAPEIEDVQAVMGEQPLQLYAPVIEGRPAGTGRWHLVLGAKLFLK